MSTLKTLITPDYAVREAFTGSDYVRAASVTEADIAAVEERYIVPVVGRTLHAALLTGEYAVLVTDYIAPAEALLVRLAVQPVLNVETSAAGLSVADSTTAAAADRQQRAELCASLRTRARALLRRLSAYLTEQAASFPEYDAEADVLKHCSIDGGLVTLL